MNVIIYYYHSYYVHHVSVTLYKFIEAVTITKHQRYRLKICQ